MIKIVFIVIEVILYVGYLSALGIAFKDKKYSLACGDCFVSGVCFVGFIVDLVHLIGG